MKKPALIDVRPEHLALVRDILRKHAPDNVNIWVFGSRAKGTAKITSDLDLVIDAGRALSPDEVFFLNDAFDASDLPYKVDIVDGRIISSKFKEMIQKDWIKMKVAPAE